MDELVGLLTRERLLLERLLFRATELRMLIGSDARFVAWASADLSAAAEALRDAELRRAVLYSEIADAHGWSAEPFDWARLVDLAGEPHATILSEIRESLSVLSAELNSQLTSIRQMGEAGLAGVTEFLESLATPEALVEAAGTPTGPVSSPWQPVTVTKRLDRTL